MCLTLLLFLIVADVLLLADVFEEFRNAAHLNYWLDPAHYITSPGLSFDAMLRTTKVQLELISDAKMFEMIDSGIRGGVAMISTRLARANNKAMGDDLFNPNEPESYIKGYDANNL